MPSEAILAIAERLQKSQNLQTAAWKRVIEEARKYAMMKAHGKYIESNGCIASIAHSDRKSYEDMFIRNLLMYIEYAYVEDAMVGVALETAK